MNALFILFLITTTEARRSSYDLSIQPNNKVFNNYANNEQPGTAQQDVDFGHVYKNGFRDSNYRQHDEESEVVEPSYSGKINDAMKKSRQTLKDPKGQPLIFLSPRDEVLYHKKFNSSNDDNKKNVSSNKGLKPTSRPIMYDFTQLLERNLANPFIYKRNKAFKEKTNKKNDKTVKQIKKINKNSSDYFEEQTFYTKKDENKLNWTKCNEFAKRAVFHPDDVVNTKWLPFYIWSTRKERIPATIHTFSYPTKKMVQLFKNTYAPYIRKLNWKEPKLLLKESREILLIAGDRKGLFHGIPKQELPSAIKGKNITLPVITLRMKIHDPYLAMMYCEENTALIMAELGTEPQSDQDKTLEADTLKFRGKGNTVYRDFEGEARLERINRMRRIEEESRKIIQIPIPSGDVDYQVRH